MLALLALVMAPPPAQPLPTLAGLPGLSVTYYDVSGKNVPEIHKSLSRAAPRGAVSGKSLPATSGWTLAARAKWTQTGKACALTSVELNFTVTASLPRLAADPTRPPPVQAAWDDYADRLEARQAEQLRFAYDRQADVVTAIRRSGCIGWEAAATTAIARIRAQQAAAFKREERTQPKLLAPRQNEDQKRSATSTDTVL